MDLLQFTRLFTCMLIELWFKLKFSLFTQTILNVTWGVVYNIYKYIQYSIVLWTVEKPYPILGGELPDCCCRWRDGMWEVDPDSTGRQWWWSTKPTRKHKQWADYMYCRNIIVLIKCAFGYFDMNIIFKKMEHSLPVDIFYVNLLVCIS